MIKLNAAKSTVLVTVWLVISIPLCYLYLTISPSPDQSLFDYIAWLSIEGEPYYSGAFELNWPGAIMLHELGQRIFGSHAWTWRLTDFIILQFCSLAGAVFLWRSKFENGAVLFLLLYPPLYITSGYWMAGQRDILATGLALIVLALITPVGGRVAAARFFTAGVVAGFVILIRPTYAALLVGIIVVEFLPFVRRNTAFLSRVKLSAAIALGALMTLGFVAAVGLHLGNIHDWYEQAVVFTATAYQSEGPRLRLLATPIGLILGSWHWIAFLGLLGFGAWVATSGVNHDTRSSPQLDRGLVLTVGLATVVFVSFFAMNKGFGYHLGGLLTVLVIWIAVLWDRLQLMRRSTLASSRLVGALASILFVALAGFGTTKKLWNYSDNAFLLTTGGAWPVHAAEPGRLSSVDLNHAVYIIERNTGPEDFIVQWGSTYELGYLAKRRPSTRFINIPVLSELDAGFPLSERWLAEIASDLESRPPVYVLIDRDFLIDQSPPFRAKPDGAQALLVLLEAISEGYEVVAYYPEALLIAKK